MHQRRLLQLLDSPSSVTLADMRSPVDRLDGGNAVTGGAAILVSSYRRPEFQGLTP